MVVPCHVLHKLPLVPPCLCFLFQYTANSLSSPSSADVLAELSSEGIHLAAVLAIVHAFSFLDVHPFFFFFLNFFSLGVEIRGRDDVGPFSLTLVSSDD